MRLRTSADRHEIRQQYLPALWSHTVGMLKNEGKDAAQDVIDFMDSYYLTKEDYDAILELGVGQFDMESIKIDAATKAQFTRLYNSQSHPMPFVKAGNSMGFSKGGGGKREKPDLEEAVDESDGEEALADADAEEDDESDLKKDKYIKAPKKKAAGGAGAKAKAKRKKGGDEESEDDSNDEPKKKRSGAAASSGRGRGGGRGRGRGKA
jgi:replication factor C subunit 1